MAFIPTNRPVLGKDLDAMRQSFGITTTDALFLFGLSITRWMYAVRRDAELPLADTSLALLLRFMDQNPDLFLLPKFPTPPDVFDSIKEHVQMHPRHFSLIMGAESTASNRWLSGSGRQSPSVMRLLWYVNEALNQASGKPSQANQSAEGLDPEELIERLIETAKLEATLRGTPDLFKAGRWPVIKQRDRDVPRDTKRSRSIAAKLAAEGPEAAVIAKAKATSKVAAKSTSKAKAKE